MKKSGLDIKKIDAEGLGLMLKRIRGSHISLENQIHELEIVLRVTNMRIADLENEKNKRSIKVKQ